MELWNDFEGKSLDGQYKLEQLIGPKGRSAFFEGRDSKGERLTIRVIESLNDEDEILARWNAVRLLHSPHLLRIIDARKTVLDEVHLVYAVLERTDAELSGILRERPLSAEETRQVAAAVLGGLEALHGRGLIHEHLEPASVLACGEEVKLRSDCVREVPEGAEGETLRRRDAHDAAMLIGQALTQRRDVGQARLPRPFDDLVRNGMSGTWGLKEMNALVQPVAVAAPPVRAAAAQPAGQRPGGPGRVEGVVAEVLAAQKGGAVGASLPPAPAGPRVAAASNGSAGARPAATEATPIRRPGAVPAGAQGVASGAAAAAGATSATAVAAALSSAQADREPVRPTRRPDANDRIVVDTERASRPPWVLWAVVAALVVLAVILVVHFSGGASKRPAAAVGTPEPAAMTPAPAVAETAGASGAAVPAVPTKPSAARQLHGARGGVVAAAGAGASAPAAAAVQHGSGPEGRQWRVLAYTYYREDQAQRKAESIAQEHPGLKAEVFSPTGKAPYLVALGGWMTNDEAVALRNKVRSQGLPRDTYAQNYHAH